MADWKNEREAREAIRALAEEYFRRFKAPQLSRPFEPGDRLPYASRVYDEREMGALTDATLDFWLTAGRFADEFERDFAAYTGAPFAASVTSVSVFQPFRGLALTATIFLLISLCLF